MPTPRRFALRALPLAALVSAMACDPAARTGGPPIDAALAGHWAQDNTVVGSAFTLSLTVTDTLVTGTGTYAIEAGRSGTLTVTGTATAALVTLYIIYDYGPVAYFEGAPPIGTVLSGAIKYGPKDSLIASYAITFHKTS